MVKRHEWVRENFYEKNLDPMFEMVEVPVVQSVDLCIKIDTKNDGIVVGGSAALYMAGYVDDIGDVDLMCLSKGSLDVFRRKTKDMNVLQSANSYNVENGVYMEKGYRVLSFPRKEYLSIAEIAYGADIEICGFVVVYGDRPRIFTTPLGLRMAEERVLLFNPKNNHLGYLERIAKYASRGFKLILPFISRSDIRPLYGYNDDASILFYIYLFKISEDEIRRLKRYDRGEKYVRYLDWHAPWIKTNRSGRLNGQKDMDAIVDVISFYKSSPLYYPL